MILTCVNSEIDSVGEICKITRLDKDAVKASLTSLNEAKYIKTSGMFAFVERKITAEGARALSVYSKTFGQEGDIVEMKQRLDEKTLEDGEDKNGQ
jgi:DNA-binding MarR family transcriptional regulator